MSNDPTSRDVFTRVLTGVSGYTILRAEDGPDGLVVSVIATSVSASWSGVWRVLDPRKGLCRSHRVADVPQAGRKVHLRVVKRSFRCDGLGCERRPFTQHTDQLCAGIDVPEGASDRTTKQCKAHDWSGPALLRSPHER
jgi:hypothetical protein